MSHPQVEPKLTTVPQVPEEFGEDGGHFYKYYDALAEELDEDMVKRLKSQLDSTLIFAGLFAGVNSAFLALVLPDMKADPADDTNALLLQLVTGDNSTIRSAHDLPSATFTPSPGILPVSVLLSLSLTLAIIASFVAIMGQQWLVFYRKRSGGGKDHQRWEQIQRHLGASRWCLEGVLNDVLPTLLQLALLAFCVGLLIYVQTLSKTVFYLLATLILLAVEIGILMGFVSAIDPWCPFKSNWSHFIQLAHPNSRGYRPLKFIFRLFLYTLWAPLIFALESLIIIAGVLLIIAAPFYILPLFILYQYYFSPSQIYESTRAHACMLVKPVVEILKGARAIVPFLRGNVLLGKPEDFVQAAVVKRVLCTSGDFNTLIYTAISIQAMKEEGAQFLLDDYTVRERLKTLTTSSEKALAMAFSCASNHLILVALSARLKEMENMSGILYRLEVFLDHGALNRLKRRLRFMFDRPGPHMESRFAHPQALVELQFYFELIEILLNRKVNDQELSKWLERVIQTQQPAEVSTPLVICLVTSTMHILDMGIESEPASPKVLGSEWVGQSRVQHRAVEVVKKLVGRVDGVMQLVRSDPSQIDRTSDLRCIMGLYTSDNFGSSRHPDKAYVWLIERALSISTANQNIPGWKFVLESSVRLLLPLGNFKGPTLDSASPQDSLKNRLRCANILSQCLHAMRDHLEADEFIQMVSPVLDSLGDYRTQLKADMVHFWLLEQVLLLSTPARHEQGWKFVAGSSVCLLSSFGNSDSSTPKLASSGDSLKNDRIRCANILSRCLQDMRDHFKADDFIKTISLALGQLVDYWAQFKDDFNQNPDLDDAAMLSTWLEIRAALDKPGELGWGPLQQQQFGEAYPSLKIGFDAIAASMFDIAPRVDRDLTVLPPVATFNQQAGRTELDHATPTGATPKPDENFDHTLEDINEDARERNSGERNEQPDEQAGHANSKPTNEDE